MTEQPEISLILPAYNEVSTIRNTVKEAATYFRDAGLAYQIVVAADGDDGTREAVREMANSDPRVEALGSPGRGGKGRGIRSAIPRCGGRWIGFADADNKVPISEFDKVRPLLRDGAQIVIGSRATERSQIERAQPLYRQIGSKGFASVMKAIVGLRGISDSQCGFKFFQRHVAADLFSRQVIDGYMFDVEILYLAQLIGYRVEEVAIRWRDDGDSRLDLISGNIQNLKDLVRIRRTHSKRVMAAVRSANSRGD